MAWISQMKVSESWTIFSESRGNGKAEREMTVSFTPGELLTNDTDSIRKYCREMSELCKCSIDEAIGTTSEPREPKGGTADKKDETPEAITDPQLKFIKDLLARHSKKYPKILDELKEQYQITKVDELTKEQANGVITQLKEKK